MRTVRTTLLYFLLTLASAGLVWLVMSERQREELLAAVGLLELATDTFTPAVIGSRSDFDTPPAASAAQAPGTGAYGTPRSMCRDRSRQITEVDREGIYRWEDDNGRPVFGDQPPPGIRARRLGEYDADEQFSRVRFKDRGRRYGPRLKSVYPGDARTVARVLRSALALPIRQVDVTVTIEPPDARLTLRDGQGRHLTGLYRSGARDIFVKEQGTFAATRATARHETSHAMLAAMYGPTPTWLNEGLAEVMSTLKVSGQLATLEVDRQHAALLKARATEFGPGSLRALLSLDGRSWLETPMTRSYSASWSLVHLLMESSAGRAMISALLAAQSEAPCRPIDSTAIIDQTWPGGATALERSWLARLSSARWAPINF